MPDTKLIPNQDEIDAVRDGIEALRRNRFDAFAMPSARGKQIWGDLIEDEKLDLMAGHLPWLGFDDNQRSSVMTAVVEGRPPDQWMDGVKPAVDRPIEAVVGRALTEIQKSWPEAASVTGYDDFLGEATARAASRMRERDEGHER